MNFELMIETFPKLLSGLNLTIQLVTISLFLGFCLAIGLALLRLSNNTFLSFFCKNIHFLFQRNSSSRSNFFNLLWNCTI